MNFFVSLLRQFIHHLKKRNECAYEYPCHQVLDQASWLEYYYQQTTLVPTYLVARAHG